MAMTLGGFAALLEPNLREVFFGKFAEITSFKNDVMGVEKSEKQTEHLLSVAGGGLYQEFKGKVIADDFVQGYQKDVTNKEFAKSFNVTYAMFKDDLYGLMKNQTSDLGRKARISQEVLAASIFNNAFNTTTGYTVDGSNANSLCYSAHPAPSGASAANQSNAGSTAISYTAITATRALMRRFVDEQGVPVFNIADTVLVPVELEKAAREAMESTFGVDTNLTSNVVGSGAYKLKLIVTEYLTDANNWFMINSELAKMFCKFFNREPLRFIASESPDTLVMTNTGYYRASVGAVRWEWVYGHNVA